MTNPTEPLVAVSEAATPKPCPFCNSLHSLRLIDNPNGRTKIVQCGCCLAEGPVPHQSLCERTDAAAIEAWNARFEASLSPHASPTMERVMRAAVISSTEEVAALSSPHVGLREALEPVRHWYESDEHEPRSDVEILRDVVADLQSDRAENLTLRRNSLSDLEIETALGSENLLFYSQDNERFRRMFATVMDFRAARASPQPPQDEMRGHRFGSPPEPVVNPNEDWCDRYADWYYQGRG